MEGIKRRKILILRWQLATIVTSLQINDWTGEAADDDNAVSQYAEIENGMPLLEVLLLAFSLWWC
jgi:hypothetical protein